MDELEDALKQIEAAKAAMSTQAASALAALKATLAAAVVAFSHTTWPA